jgi:hypothetical protein
MTLTRTAIATLALCCAATPALALDFTMNFDEIPRANTPPESNGDFVLGSEILGYYNGDPEFGRSGNQAFDVNFFTGALAINSREDENGGGTFDRAYSGLGALGTVSNAEGASFELTTGVSLSALSFWYSAGGSNSNPSLQLFSGGTSVFSESLAICADPNESDGFCAWEQYVLSDRVVADLTAQGKLITGVTFGATPNKAVFDDVSLTTATGVPVIPEPSTYALMALGLALVAGTARRRAG